MLVIFEFFWEAIVTAEQHLTRLQVLHQSLYNFSLTSINSNNSGFTSLRDYLGDSLQKLRETERCVIDINSRYFGTFAQQ